MGYKTYTINGKGKGVLTSVPPEDFVEVGSNLSSSNGGGSSDLTLEQARQNGNVLEGDIQFLQRSRLLYEDDNYINFITFYNNSIGITSKNKTNSNSTNITIKEDHLLINTNTLSNSKGVIGSSEFNKQGDRKTFAQLSDVYDANSYSTTETKTGGTWGGLPIYRKIVSISIDPDFPILEDYIDLETFFPGIVNVVHSSFETDREDFGGAISYTNSVDGLFNWEISKIFGEPMKLTGRKYDGTFMDLNDMYGVTITLEYTKTTD